MISGVLNYLNVDLLTYDLSQFVYSCSNSKFILFQHTNTRYELKKKRTENISEATDTFKSESISAFERDCWFPVLKRSIRSQLKVYVFRRHRN